MLEISGFPDIPVVFIDFINCCFLFKYGGIITIYNDITRRITMELLIQLNKILLDFKRSLKESDFSFSNFDYAVILYCIDSGDSYTVSIAKKLHKDKSYVFRILNKMIKDDILIKVNNHYEITPIGREVLEAIKEENNKFFKQMGDLNILQIKQELEKLLPLT